MTPALDAVRREELRKLIEVKPLEWRPGKRGIEADSLIGTYSVCHDGEEPNEWSYDLHGRYIDFEPSEEAAVAAAQRHYDKAIRSTIAYTTLALLAYIAELEAGLRPFAEAADSLDEQRRDTSEIWEDPAAMAITAGDLRRAATLLPKASVREERG